MGKCAFRLEWLKNPLYSEWLAADNDDRYSAYCIACRKEFGLGTMGEYSLKSHASGKTHQKNISILKENTKISFSTSDTPCSLAVMRRDGTEQSAVLGPVPSPIQPIDLKGTPTLSHYLDSNAVLRAEILWVLHTISCYNSYNSNEGISKVFAAMFPDSEIARRFSCGGKKTAYLTVFGLAEYFKRSFTRLHQGRLSCTF